MQPNTFHLGQRERTWLVPDRVGHRQPTQIMNQRRPPDQPDVGQSHSWCGGPGQIGHSARVADGERGLEVGEVTDRAERGVDLVATQHST